MAKNYNDIYTAVYTKGNKMDFGNSMIRGNAIPLDITAVYNSYSAAQAYVNSNPVAYEGQVLAVTENNDTVVYVIAARLGTDGTTVEHYLKEVGKTPEVDNVTIKLVDGKLTAVIPEYADTDTQYTLSVLADGKIAFASDIDGEEATEISFVGAQGITVTSNAETGVITITGPDLSGYATKTEMADKADATSVYTKTETDGLLNAKANSADVYTKDEVDGIVDGLEEEIGKKANATEVYTKTEADEAIGKAVAAADHLKRKIVDSKEEIDINANDAMQYIYMIPSGLTANDNKYYEYIVLEENGVRYIEQVGNWEVDLKDYLTVANANETYAKKNDVAETYATKDAVAETYATKAEVNTALEDYDTAEEIAEVYATKAEVNTALEAYDTAEEIAEVYATKAEVEEEFKSYSTTEEIAAEYVSNDELTTALEPYAKKTDLPTDYVSDSEFEEAMKAYDTAEVAKGKYADKGETELALSNRYTKEEANSLLAEKANSSDVYTKTEVNNIIGIPGTPEIKDDEGNVITDAVSGTGIYQHIYSKDEITDLIADITGGESAADVKAELTAYKTSNDTRVKNIEDILNEKVNIETFASLEQLVGEVDTKVTNLETSLSNYVLKTTYDEKMTSIDNDIATLKQAVTWEML